MALTDNLTSFSAALAKLPQQRIAQAISALLLIYIAFIAAKFTWLMAPQQPIGSNTISIKQIVQKNTSEQGVNSSALQALNLFGQFQEQAQTEVVEQITDAPETRLQLTLSGLVASDKPETAAAIIEYQGKQETYGISDLIKGTRASLEQVLIDRVIIKQSGRLETLMLDGADYNQPAQSISSNKSDKKSNQKTANAVRQPNKSRNSPKIQSPISELEPSVVDQRDNDDLSQSAQELRDDLSDDPSKITDYLSISPARQDGELVGYRLSPGKNPDFFKLSGLKSGDIAVQMNGFDLLAPIEAAQAMSALKTERDISLLVQREDDLVEILFSID